MASTPQMGDLSLGARIRLAREEAGLTIKELARRIDVSRDSLSDYENDVTGPPATKLGRIAEETDTSADWLLWGATRPLLNADEPAHRLEVVPPLGKAEPPKVRELV